MPMSSSSINQSSNGIEMKDEKKDEKEQEQMPHNYHIDYNACARMDNQLIMDTMPQLPQLPQIPQIPPIIDNAQLIEPNYSFCSELSNISNTTNENIDYNNRMIDDSNNSLSSISHHSPSLTSDNNTIKTETDSP
eukprot:379377_1